jgi:DNA-binding transcriptional MerR regulator
VRDVFDAVELLTLSEVSDRLNISVGKVRRLIEEFDLLTIKDGKEPKVPAELIHSGEPLHGLRGTIILLRDSGLELDEITEWLYTPNENLVDHGSTPMAALIAGHKSPVRRAAQMLAI